MVQQPPPWLSVLIPAFRVDDFLPGCLDSIFRQDTTGVEVLIVDDGGPATSARLIADLARRHGPSVRVITHATNRGISVARNTLLGHANGDYLWFVDPDDLLEPGAIAGLKAIVDTHAPDLVMCDFRVLRHDARHEAGAAPHRRFRERRRDLHVHSFEGRSNELSTSTDDLVRGLFAAGHMQAWSKIVRRAAWPESLRFPEGRMFEDLRLFPHLALAVRSWVHAPSVWYAYRQHGASMMNTLSAAQLHDWLTALAGYTQALAASGHAFGQETLFQVAHFQARAVHTCAKKLRRAQDRRDGGSARSLYARYWQDTSPLGARRLAWLYLRRLRLRQSLRLFLQAGLAASTGA